MTADLAQVRRTARRLAPLAVLAAVAAIALPSAARADGSVVSIVGTSDVSDSNLVQSAIIPGFEAAYPQYTMTYKGEGTGAAIADAEAGNFDGLIVHAASLENQFVAAGYSAEPFGRAIFWGDYVLLGPTDDPAGVMNGAQHDIASAFEKIAAAGAAGKATFVSRGGTPGTTVQEHAIWALTGGVQTCTVSAANGGGVAPSTTTGACPASSDNPTWYQTTGLQQGPNLVAADACNFPNGHCYVFTDRGTFQYQQSIGAIHGLEIVTRNNDANARGGVPALVNSFHIYAINPSRVPGGSSRNLAGALALNTWLTSPAGQAAVKNYLGATGDPPFLPSAAPSLTTTGVPATLTAGTSVTVSGDLRNVVPGMPALDGVAVNVNNGDAAVATANTDANGHYSITFTPTRNGSYSVASGPITKIENATLNPQFGDLLQPQTTFAGVLTVQSAIEVASAKATYRRVTVAGSISPAGDDHALVTISARRSGKGRFVNYAKGKPAANGSYSIVTKLPPGRWQIQARYDDPGAVISSVAPTVTTTVPGSSSVKISTLAHSGRKVTLSGRLSPAPKSSGAYVKILARHTKKLAAAGAAPKFHAVGRKVAIKKGRKTYRISANLKRGYHWQVRVEYVHKKQIDTATSSIRSVNVR